MHFCKRLHSKIGLKKFPLLGKVKNTVLCKKTLLEKKLFERFMKKNCERQIKKSLELKKAIERKGEKLYVKEKDYGNSLIAG